MVLVIRHSDESDWHLLNSTWFSLKHLFCHNMFIVYLFVHCLYRPTNVGLSAATSHCSTSSRGGGRRQRIRYLFELESCCPMDKAECDMRKKIFFSLLKQHVNNIALGTAMATIGMLLTIARSDIASLICILDLITDTKPGLKNQPQWNHSSVKTDQN